MRTLRYAAPCAMCGQLIKGGHQEEALELHKTPKGWEAICGRHANEKKTLQTTVVSALREVGARTIVIDGGKPSTEATPTHDSLTLTHKCPSCLASYATKASLSQHMRHQHGGVKNKNVNVVAERSTMPKNEAAKTCDQIVNEVGATTGKNDRRFLNAYGKRKYEEIERLLRSPLHLPIGLRGPSGFGKSAILGLIAQTPPWNGNYASDGCHDGMDIESLVGTNWPSPTPERLTVWRDGQLTSMARSGGIYHMEEVANAPSEMLSRLHQIMDEGDMRYLSLPESEESRVVIHPDFRFVASWNPPAKGYQSTRLTAPVMHRWGAIIDMDKPIANERLLLKEYVDDDTANRIMRFAKDVRDKGSVTLSTRDIKLLAQVISAGFDPIAASEISLQPKYEDAQVRDGIKASMAISFDMSTTVPDMTDADSEGGK